jgi:transposase
VNSSNLGDQVASAAARLGVSRRTVFRWLAAYRTSPQGIVTLPTA